MHVGEGRERLTHRHLASDRISGGELLLRLREGDQVIGPEAFLGIANSHGLSLAIDRIVVVEAIRVASQLSTPPDFRWEVNLSVAGICDSSLLTLIESELQSRQVPASCLVFEITETSAISNMEQAKAFATAIRRLGCGFAIDDFGRGYGSFYYLKHLPLDYLKIDGEFIRELTADATNRIIVESILTAARRFGLKTVAEYVPDQETLDLLHSYHVDYAGVALTCMITNKEGGIPLA